jgi:hypothetical protein
MAAVGVAAVATLEMVDGCEDEVWAFVVEVFGEKLGLGWSRSFFSGWIRGGLGGVLHC